MKKILLTLTAVLALTLTGCNSGSTQEASPALPIPVKTITAYPEPAPTVTVTAEAEPGVLDTDKTSERTFLMALRGTNPALNNWTDELIMDHAERVCVELDGGADLQDFIMGTLQIRGELDAGNGYGSPLGTVIAGTVLTYCPQHRGQITAMTSNL